MQDKMKNKLFQFDKGVYACVALFLFLCAVCTGQVAFGLLALVVWMWFAVGRASSWEWCGNSLLPRIFFGSLSILSFAMILLVGLYFLFGLSIYTAFLWMTILTMGVSLIPEGKRLPIPEMKIKLDVWVLVFFFTDLLLLALFIAARTDTALVSPWILFNGEIFVLFLISTIVYLLNAHRYSFMQAMVMGMFHSLAALSVSTIIYGIGFGFDPFIHRAAEEAMIQLGSIEPHQLLYVGQYTFLSALHLLTNIPVTILDIWYVPVLAGVVLPMTTYVGLRQGFGLSEDQSKRWWMAVYIYPFMLLTFSVPFTLTYAFFIGILFAGFTLMKMSRPAQLVVSASSFALALFHPLLCVPLGFWLAQLVFKRRWVRVTCLILLAFSLPMLLTFYQYSQGQVVHVYSLIDNVGAFFNLFRNPFYDPYPFIPWHLDALYAIRYWFPYVMVLAGTGVMMATWRHYKRQWQWLLGLITGLMIAMYIMSTLFVFKDIIVHEQAEFALRLLHVWYGLFLVPCVVGLAQINHRKARLMMQFVTACLVVIAWYFSYPQFNLQYPFYSPSVSVDDVEVVHVINEAADESYLVLSNQLTSAAALQEFGFDQTILFDDQEILRYAIPTGGILYPYYTRLFAGEDPNVVIHELFEYAQVDQVYLVTHAYWSWAPLEPGLLQTADEIGRTSSNQITYYLFKRYEEDSNTD